MPSLQIFGKYLKTNPFGQDDLHFLCLGLGAFRIVQLCIVVPMWIFLYLKKWQERDAVGSDPELCGTEREQRYLSSNDTGLLMDNVIDEATSDGEESTGRNGMAYLITYIYISFIYSIVDVAVLAAIWSAASVGTPTDPMGRDVFLKPLFRFKVIIMNAVLAALVVLGILMVYFSRSDDYGCNVVKDSEGEMIGLESTVWYIWFCIMLVLQAIELFVWPMIIANKISRYIRNHQALDDDRRRTSRREQCLGACLACLGALSCFKSGGQALVAKKGGFTDATKAMMDFMHTGGTLDIVFSDIYIAFKMLVRVQRERIYRFIHQHINDLEIGAGEMAGRSIGVGHWSSNAEEGDASNRQKAVLEIDSSKARDMLSASNENDVAVLKEANHFAAHSDAIYGAFQDFLQKNQLLPKGSNDFLATGEGVAVDEIGFDDTSLIYAQYRQSGIDETPYAILIDRKWQTVIVTIRGSASLEDMAVDLQLTPEKFEAIGLQCGFDGSDQFCHKGVLARAQWIYEDIRSCKLLDSMLLGENQTCPGYKLVITGHSLGAGCSALLSIMLRQKFPGLQCYAFCPPGGLITERLALECKDYVTSFINSCDIVPRMSFENMERLRDEALEVLARIKVSKRKLLQILSKDCADEDLSHVNSLLLYRQGDIPKTTTYYSQLQEFKRAQLERKEASDANYIPLIPPGKIVFFAKAKRGYVPQWSQADEFNEILLAPTMAQDHSITSVMENLKDILNEFEDPSTGRFEEEEEDEKPSRLSAAERTLNTSILEAPTFVCCSRPHGNVVIIIGLVGITALVLSFLANNHCGFVSRSAVWSEEDADTGDVLSYNGIGVSTGLWSFLEKVYSGSGPENDPASYVNGEDCRPFLESMEPDGYLTAARACGTAATLLGGLAVLLIWFASCVTYRVSAWHCITACLLLASILSGLTFLVFQSNLCHTLEIPALGVTIESQCAFGWGSAMAIAATVVWFITAVCTVHYPLPKTAAERMLQWLGENEE